MYLADFRTVEEMAEAFAGNWKRFDSFGWHDKPPHADRIGIYHLDNRDSGCLDQSNAAAIRAELEPFMGRTVFAEHFSHWAVGWVDAISVVVYTKSGRITRAFRKLYELATALADYPVLDESDFSRREWEEYEQSWRNGAASDLYRAIRDKFNLRYWAVDDVLGDVDYDEWQEFYESLDPPFTYDGESCWPCIETVVRTMTAGDVARLVREKRAKLRAVS